jgi:hypothetical protein
MSGSVSLVDGHVDPNKGSTAFKSWINSDFFTCPVCGKRFYIPPYVTEWTYKIKIKGYPVPVCSYSCFNKATPNRKLKGEHYLKNINKWQKKKGSVGK